MNLVYFVAPIMTPIEMQRPPPTVYFPLSNIVYRFPIPVQYSQPPTAIL